MSSSLPHRFTLIGSSIWSWYHNLPIAGQSIYESDLPHPSFSQPKSLLLGQSKFCHFSLHTERKTLTRGAWISSFQFQFSLFPVQSTKGTTFRKWKKMKSSDKIGSQIHTGQQSSNRNHLRANPPMSKCISLKSASLNPFSSWESPAFIFGVESQFECFCSSSLRLIYFSIGKRSNVVLGTKTFALSVVQVKLKWKLVMWATLAAQVACNKDEKGLMWWERLLSVTELAGVKLISSFNSINSKKVNVALICS